MKLAANGRQRPSQQCTKRLLFTSGHVTKYTNIFRKDVLPGADNGDGLALELMRT